MKVRELISVVNDYDVKVKFDIPEVRAINIMNGQSPLYFTPIEGKQRKKYDKSENKSNFFSSTAAIHIIDLDIEQLVNIFECDGTGINKWTRNIIKEFCIDGIPEDIVYVIFIFLHEVGHWNQFLNLKKNVKKFIDEDLEMEKRIFDKFKTLKTPIDKEKANRYMSEYRNIPKEKEADEFALNNIKRSVEKYREYINGKNIN